MILPTGVILKITNICYEHLRIESEIIHLYYLLSDEAISFSPCDSNLLLESQFSAFFLYCSEVLFDFVIPVIILQFVSD